MTLHGSSVRLSIYIGESDQYHHKPLYAEIVHRAHAAAMAGASVFRGFEGFGASSHLHTTRVLSLSEDLPLVVIIIDTEQKIRAFLPQVEELVTRGLITLEAVDVVRYVAQSQGDR
jgi:PII-like signaling protein